MVGVKKLEHVELTVENFDEALTFCTDVMGLSEIDRSGGTAYLGCGFDENYDLAVCEGDPGLEHFAIRVGSDAELDAQVERLRERDIEFTETADAEPNQKRGVRVTLPSGPTLELVTVEDTDYSRLSETRGGRSGEAGPVDIDHVNLLSTRPKADAEFLTEMLAFAVSDVFEPGPERAGAWLRYGDYHHDVAISRTDDEALALHHVAWTTTDIAHTKRLCDAVAQSGLELELGISRHAVGDNIFAYFWAPGGHRFELSTEMATLDPATSTRHHDDVGDVLTAWGAVDRPKSFNGGS